MKRVMVDMSATIIHHGHIRLLKRAKEYGKVIVGLTTDDEILSKKGYVPELNFEQRKEVLESIKYVDEVVPTPWLLDESVLDKYNIDLLVHGADNSNPISKDRLLVFPRTDGISSTQIRQRSYEIYIQKQDNILDKWNEVKKDIQNSRNKFFREKEIYFVSVGRNIGYEIYGKKDKFLRPVLVYKKLSRYNFIGIPLTTKEKSGDYFFNFLYKKDKISTALLNQIRVFDSKRIEYFSGKMKNEDFNKLEDKVIEFMSITHLKKMKWGHS
jgi:glycerol-3-phosphate cytidylyltransferase